MKSHAYTPTHQQKSHSLSRTFNGSIDKREEELFQKEIEFTLQRFEKVQLRYQVKKRKGIIEAQLFMCEHEKQLLTLELDEARRNYDYVSVHDRRALKHKLKSADIVL